jgi:hypothetical protein
VRSDGRVRHRPWPRGFSAGVLLLILSSACAPRTFTPPAPGGAPAPEGAAQFKQAVAACAGITAVAAEAGLSGRVAGARARGRLHLGFSRDGGLRIEGIAPFGAPVFILAGTADKATLLLPRDQRVVSDMPARELVAALAGLALEPRELLEMVTGCLGSRDALEEKSALRAGRTLTWVRTAAGVEAWIDTAPAAPLVVAVRRGPLLVDYPQRASGTPQTIHVVQQDAGQPRATDLTLRLSDVELNASLPAAAFTVDVPAGAQPMTLDELRRSGPLGR